MMTKYQFIARGLQETVREEIARRESNRKTKLGMIIASLVIGAIVGTLFGLGMKP